VAGRGPSRPNDGRSFIDPRERTNVTYVVLVIVAVLLLAGLFYVRGRRT
jgi:hypothetical protein